MSHLVERSVGRPVGRSVSRSVRRSVGQLVSQPCLSGKHLLNSPSLGSQSISTVYTDEPRLESPDDSLRRSRFKFSYDRSTTKDPECRDRFTIEAQFFETKSPREQRKKNDPTQRKRKRQDGRRESRHQPTFQLVEPLELVALHDFQGTAGDLGHVAQHQDAHVFQSVEMPVIDRPFVAQSADVDLRTVGIAEVGKHRFSRQLLQKSQVLGARHHIADERRSVPEASDGSLVAPGLGTFGFGPQFTETDFSNDFHRFRGQQSEGGSESQFRFGSAIFAISDGFH